MAISHGESFRQARRLYDERRSPQTTREMRQLLTESSHEASVIRAITVACDYLNSWNEVTLADVSEAWDVVRPVLKADPLYFLAHYAKGFINRARNQHTAAYEAFSKAIEYAPDFARAYAQRGEELVYLGRPEQGIEQAEQALRLRGPESIARGTFHWIIGRAHFFMGNDAEATKHLVPAVELWPNLWYNRCYLIAAYAQLKDSTAAAAALRELDSVPEFAGYTLKKVLENETHVPSSNPFVQQGRQRFHESLLLGGMPQ